ncbi:RagB/SusD family nutrient uptake outer membrane protein [Flavobacterium sp. LMO8]|uniref:RagB/SusD family nutrient uptake outer membrane protein n=1 Tax=Flavobacterium sp. LMO8 TaxID=2654244 RepID=UPI001291911B|nr:RagB/SusD family nutrient uptake outer membrane protein [Flavobacterium sp. LMO8]MQP25655.1 RagB/SusD family nutrient uptake outer membrane protein [Flavobacterium sp. LMO8]
MKNRIIKIIVLGLFTGLGFVSCDDFLDKQPITEYNLEQLFATEEGAETVLNGLYARLAGPGYYGSSWHGMVNPHSGRMFSNQSVTADATGLNCSTSNRWLEDLWPAMYGTIEQANIVIDNMENSNLANKDFVLGQAYLIRGIVYFDLVRLFGGVPIKNEPTSLDNLNKPRASKSEVYDLILSDLDRAKDLLPEDFSNYRSDRPLKWAAIGYKAKVYMQLAGEDGGNPALWQNAYDEAIQVYTKYSLHPNYGNMFLSSGWNENTAEAIFELQYDHFGNIRNSDRIRMYTPSNSTFNIGFNTFGWVRPNKEIYDQHNTQYPGDPRIAATFIWGSFPRATGGNTNIYPTIRNGANGFAVIKKWFDTSYNGTTTAKNFTLFRYADLLLMLAEIENELNGPDNAYQYVNLVLTRARNSAVPAAAQPTNWAAMTQDQFRDRIMKERQYELLSEGQDWFDARRRGFNYFLNNTIIPHNSHPTINVGNSDYLYPTTDRAMLLPILNREIANNNNMSPSDQNPGY